MEEAGTHSAKPSAQDLRRLCVELQSLGIRAGQGVAPAGRCGGAGPSEGRVIVIGGRHISVPSHSWYAVRSPYAIEQVNGSLAVTRSGRMVAPVEIPAQPRFYARETSRGIPLQKIALLHGSACLASTVFQDCAYRGAGRQCTFCGIGQSLEKNATVPVKEPEDLALAARWAAELDGAAHVTLTAGHCPPTFDLVDHYCRCIDSIKTTADMPVHVQLCPPERSDAYRVLRGAGADTIGIHCESWDEQALLRQAPAKAAAGLDVYRRHWEQAVAAFGPNQVSSFLIAGLGENEASIPEGADCMARMGVFPYVLPLRPLPGTPLASCAPPPPDYMVGLYEQVAGIVSEHGLASRASRAGCVRCGACSCMALFEDGHGA